MVPQRNRVGGKVTAGTVAENTERGREPQDKACAVRSRREVVTRKRKGEEPPDELEQAGNTRRKAGRFGDTGCSCST